MQNSITAINNSKENLIKFCHGNRRNREVIIQYDPKKGLPIFLNVITY